TKLLQLAPGLKWIHVNMAGVDHLYTADIEKQGVILTNAAGVLYEAIAEFVLGAVLIWTKGLHLSVLHTQQRRWEEREPLPNSGLRALIIGAGGIGTACAQTLKKAGFSFVAGIRQSSKELDAVFNERIELENLRWRVGGFDAIICSLPATEATSSVIDEVVLNETKNNMVFVNVGRGTTVAHHDLAQAMQDRPGSLAVLDVTDPEPLPPQHPLWECSNVIVSPHMAGETKERHDNYSKLFFDNLNRYLDGRPLRNQISF